MGSRNWRRQPTRLPPQSNSITIKDTSRSESKSKSKRGIEMAKEHTKIEDYGFLSDTQTGALVSRDGCVDWLCFPRFDSPACFASLVGDSENGHWRFFSGENGVAPRPRFPGETLNF